MAEIIAPRRGEQFVDVRTGAPLPRPMKWIEEISRVLNTNNSSILSRLDILETQKVVLTSADSPYLAAQGDEIVCDMSAGDIEVQLPDPDESSVHISVSRKGSGNVLSVTGLLGIGSPMYIRSNNSCADLFPTETEWRLG